MGWKPPSKRLYTDPIIRTKEDTKWVKINFFNDVPVVPSLTRDKIWDKLIQDTKAVFVFSLFTTMCHVYTVEYYDLHPSLRIKHRTAYITKGYRE